jgi:uncharacterized membrane protein
MSRITFEHISEGDREKASNSYVMSVVAIVAGLPLPIVNLIATLIFFLGNRRSSPFVRWHCTQALLSQAVLFLLNTRGFWWTISILFWDEPISNEYIGYMIGIGVLNLVEFFATIVAAVQVRKGKHLRLWLFADLTDTFFKKNDE